MMADVDLAAAAELMTTHRASLLVALMGGEAHSAGELASRTGISPSLASSHLSRLLDGGLVTVTQSGRRRHYRIANSHVAEVIEAMLTLAPSRRATSLSESRRGHAIRHARTCYDHLAGEVGVALGESMQREGLIESPDNSFALTGRGEQRLRALGIDVLALRDRRRAFARPCLDWTERRPHLAGSLGAAIAEHALERDWLERVRGSRALRVTEDGRIGLRDHFGLNLDPTG